MLIVDELIENFVNNLLVASSNSAVPYAGLDVIQNVRASLSPSVVVTWNRDVEVAVFSFTITALLRLLKTGTLLAPKI